MNSQVNETHDPALKSWVASANDGAGDFPVQNLPYGIFRRDQGETPRVGVRIGALVLDLAACADARLLGDADEVARACAASALNALMSLGPEKHSALRRRLSQLLRFDSAEQPHVGEKFFAPAAEVEMLVPAEIGDYTDFYASLYHATNVGSMFRPNNPLLPNYKHVPIAYHGRASSIVVSGTPITRPLGQTKNETDDAPTFGPSRRLDYEAEIGFFVGAGNKLGEPVPVAHAEAHLFGVCLVNDWSARDMQTWEYQPLGPFLAKNFATTVSPWVVTIEALTPFRVAAFARAPQDPPPLPYLFSPHNERLGGIDLSVEVYLRSAQMRDRGVEAVRLSRSNLRQMYWTAAQMIAHHTSNGCNLRPGDLLASGTVSGETKDSRGCLLELTWRGTEPFTLPTGEQRRFLEDGDEITMRAACERDGFARLGFGECSGRVLSAED